MSVGTTVAVVAVVVAGYGGLVALIIAQVGGLRSELTGKSDRLQETVNNYW
jgi:hypothetical protein